MPAARADALEGSAGAGNSCLLAFTSAPSTQPGFMSLSAFGGGLHGPIHTCPEDGKPGRLLGAPGLTMVPRCAACMAIGAAPRQSEDKVRGFPCCGGQLGRGRGCLFAFSNAQL